MSVTTPRTLPRRVEPVLLPLLREEFPDVVFSSIRSRDNPPRECVIIGEPGQKATPVVTIGHESGPMRMTDENGCLMAYLVLLLTVETN